MNNHNLEISILRDGAIAVYHSTEFLNEDLEWFQGQNYKIYSVDLVDVASTSDFYQTMTVCLDLWHEPNNLDALYDLLCDIQLGDAQGGIIVLRSFDRFFKTFPTLGYTLLDFLANISRLYLIDRLKLICLIHTSTTELTLPKVGGFYISSNPRESLRLHQT
jgi:hypothetical protein